MLFEKLTICAIILGLEIENVFREFRPEFVGIGHLEHFLLVLLFLG